ncbi:hypothetical protein HY450_00055 [Candidatus Pacearchaeota archaeon]|nr:hypothetical protein [Candidatus Pacearchaeota archaeon]
MEKKRIIKLIKNKKELSGIADSVVLYCLDGYLKKYKIKKELLDKKEEKIIVKEIRKELRGLSGRFQKGLKRRGDLLNKDINEEILATHSSTKERVDYYPELKNIIKKMEVKSVLDLGCGINPIALAERGMKYYAVDINEKELYLVKRFFEQKKIEGKTIVYDLRKINDNLPDSELCLILKVFDVIENKGHRLTELIIERVKCKKFIASFPTKKLSGKPMKFPERKWFEKILIRKGYFYKKVYSENEVFYIFDKSNTNE